VAKEVLRAQHNGEMAGKNLTSNTFREAPMLERHKVRTPGISADLDVQLLAAGSSYNFGATASIYEVEACEEQRAYILLGKATCEHVHHL